MNFTSCNNSNITFVSAFIKVYDEPFQNKDVAWRLGKFRIIAETGIQLYIYVSPEYQDAVQEFIQEFPNVKIGKIMSIEDTFVSQVVDQINNENMTNECVGVPVVSLPQCNRSCETIVPIVSLPNARNQEKDTKKYILLQNAKAEFVYDATIHNPWSSTHFAWIDFNVAHVFKNNKSTQEFLSTLSKRTLASSFLTIPGCWPKIANIDTILNNIHWRFCGGFFLGDKESIVKLYNLYQEYWPQFIEKHRKLVWEVNFWAYLEYIQSKEYIQSEFTVPDWTPAWFNSDHNDTIFHISADYCSKRLFSCPSTVRQTYDYPKIEGFTPTSAAYLYDPVKKVHMLNTRFVNYAITDRGYYLFSNPDSKLFTKNVYSELDEETLKPKFYREMQDPVDLPKVENCKVNGLEDIRLFLDNDQDQAQDQDEDQDPDLVVKFIATTVNYSPTLKNRMVIGKYDVEKMTFTDCNVIESPDKNNCCEKNWVTGNLRFPLCAAKTNPPFDSSLNQGKDKTGKEGVVGSDALRASTFNHHSGDCRETYGFPTMYGWYPQKIGHINPETLQLEIFCERPISAPYFERVRGSSQYVEHSYLDASGQSVDVLVGVVHFSEEYSPRHYFHILVMLEPGTMKLLKYSEIFYFDKIGIEFCIGFMIRDLKYHFWISKNDCDPELVVCSLDSIQFL
jgi:hypothetical protein